MRDVVERARELFRQRAWADAIELLAAADRSTALSAADLELLAIATRLLGREDDALVAFERAHRAHLVGEPADPCRAARCAFWSALFLLLRGDVGQANGWLARAQRLVVREPGPCVEAGYLLIPVAEQQLVGADFAAALATATDAADVGVHCHDRDLIACARHLQGRALLGGGAVERGLALLDEAMLAVTSDAVSPLFAGLIYCSVIEACLRVHAFARAREWTAALAAWIERQPQLVAFTGTCIVHRVQIHQLDGRWQDALAEAQAVCDRFAHGVGRRPPAALHYERGEVLRLRGDFAAAEASYRAASDAGRDPQPGLALLRLAQGRVDAATGALRRVLAGTTDPLDRSRLLVPATEALLAAGDVGGARDAVRELTTIGAAFPGDALRAMAAYARAATELAAGEAAAAVAAATDAWRTWERLGVPYEAARARELLARACAAVGDDDGSTLHRERACAEFAALGAVPDVERTQAGGDRCASGATVLTARELDVLRLIAAGKTNRAIAHAFDRSEKTIERHVSNLFVKIDVTSRAAATAYAYRHKLV